MLIAKKMAVLISTPRNGGLQEKTVNVVRPLTLTVLEMATNDVAMLRQVNAEAQSLIAKTMATSISNHLNGAHHEMTVNADQLSKPTALEKVTNNAVMSRPVSVEAQMLIAMAVAISILNRSNGDHHETTQLVVQW